MIGGDLKALFDATIDIAKRVRDQELNSKLLGIQGAMMDFYGEYQNEKDARDRAEKKIREMEVALIERDRVVVHDAMSWKQRVDGKEEGPYCAHCHVMIGKLIPLITIASNEVFDCPQCHERFTTDAYHRKIEMSSRHPYVMNG